MKRNNKTLLLWVFPILLTACTVRIIAPYDEVTDRGVSDLQKVMVTKFIQWGRSIPPIADEYPFYDNVNASLEVLIDRNQNIPKSTVLVGMLQKVEDNVQILEGLHANGKLTSAVIEQTKPDIMAQLDAIQKFQMALKAEAKK